ncbi:MAG TPA: phosphoglycolate phosphatase [Casimicrobiaceae bacterium]|nr:phosphoglycolate phosphatase [Casimicrobiaceae bacterium]
MSVDTVSPVRTFEVSAVAIDLDGTLLDTVHDLAAAVNALLVEWGLAPLPVERVRSLVGKGMANLVRRAVAEARGISAEAIDDDEAREALELYQQHYHTVLGRHTRIFEGVREGLARMADMGLPMAVITNKATRFVRPHLVQSGLHGYFKLVLGAEDHPTKKPDPGPLLHVAQAFGIAPSRLLMVGDSVNDAQAARAAGCPVLIVPYGYNEGEPVQSIDADGIVPSLKAVADCIRPVPISR